MINILICLTSLNVHPLPPAAKWDEYLFDDRVVPQAIAFWDTDWTNPFLPGIMHLVPAVRGES